MGENITLTSEFIVYPNPFFSCSSSHTSSSSSFVSSFDYLRSLTTPSPPSLLFILHLTDILDLSDMNIPYHMHSVTESTTDYNLGLFPFSFTGVSSHVPFLFSTFYCSFFTSLFPLCPSLACTLDSPFSLLFTFSLHLIGHYLCETLEGIDWSEYFLVSHKRLAFSLCFFTRPSSI